MGFQTSEPFDETDSGRESAPAEVETAASDLPVGNHSATVFSGTTQEWVRYLEEPWERRTGTPPSMQIVFSQTDSHFDFLVEQGQAHPWAERLQMGFQILKHLLTTKPSVLSVYESMVFGNTSNRAGTIQLLMYPALPGSATREVQVDADFRPLETRILINEKCFVMSESIFHSLPKKPSSQQFLGAIWPVLSRVLLQLSYPSYPRDRFTERIDISTQWALLHLHLLYSGKSKGELEPNAGGVLYQAAMAKEAGMEVKALAKKHPLFRLLNDVSFLLNDRGLETLMDIAKVVVRDYLDSRYLRLSIAGIMPPLAPWLRSMPYEWKKKDEIKTPPPVVGQYGIIDEEDLDAWKKVAPPLRNLGYFIIGQLGMGQFGRVYRAVNARNSNIPPVVAIKVDRIRKKGKKEAIEAAETIMQIARGLAASPHVIRVFDAGKLKKESFTYHVLQVVEGDTLDNLIGVTGLEHASVLRPTFARLSDQEVQREFFAAMNAAEGEKWRRDRRSFPFISAPNVSQMLDLFTSKILWVEEVHGLGFAINDLKNGNVMISRRGQFKGIDLDSYSHVFSPMEKKTDFFFLAISALQLLTRGFSTASEFSSDGIRSLLSNPGRLKSKLEKIWPYQDLQGAKGRNLTHADVVEYFVDFVENSRSGCFANEPLLFSQSIDRLIHLKRSLAIEEIVLE